jgi:hypothetical protein
MAVTAEQVYNMALVYIDEVTDDGEVVAENPNYYKSRSLSILTALQTELLPKTIEPVAITDLSQELLLPSRLALSALPYGLAAHLLINEDPTSASFFNNRYDELKSKQQTETQPIEDKYSVLGGMQ